MVRNITRISLVVFGLLDVGNGRVYPRDDRPDPRLTKRSLTDSERARNVQKPNSRVRHDVGYDRATPVVGWNTVYARKTLYEGTRNVLTVRSKQGDVKISRVRIALKPVLD